MGHGPSPDPGRFVTRSLECAGVFALIAAALTLPALAGCSAGSGPLDASGPGEIATRTVRLAGFERAAAGEDGHTAVIGIETPGPDTVADVHLTLQTGAAALAAAYPSATTYEIRLVWEGSAFAASRGEGRPVREAVERDDPLALHAALDFELLPEPDGGTGFPEESDAPLLAPADAAYHDAKNRAAALLVDGSGSVLEGSDRLAVRAAAVREAAPGRAAVEAQDAARVYAEEILATLDAGEFAGAERLRDVVVDRANAGALDATTTRELRAWSLLISALVEPSSASVLRDTGLAAEEVAAAPLSSGVLADAVLVAARSADAPASMRDASAFEPTTAPGTSAEATPSAAPTAFAFVAAGDAGLPVLTVDGQPFAVRDREWTALRRADGSVYARSATRPDIAVRDASVRGWAFSRDVLHVVDASDVGVVYAAVGVGDLVW